eukprot:gene12196-16339_t
MSSYFRRVFSIRTKSISDSDKRIENKPIVANIYVDRVLLQYLGMKDNEKKSRLLISSKEEIISTMDTSSLKTLIEKRIPTLSGKNYILRYRHTGDNSLPKQFETDETAATMLKQLTAKSLFSLQLYVDINPGIFPPSDFFPAYLHNMPDPLESDSFTMVSFYGFSNIQDPENFAKELELLWRPFKTYGRVYVAREGVNAQMAIPTNTVSCFKAATKSVSIFHNFRLNVDHLISKFEFNRTKPFKALHIRIRDQIVADGLDQPLDWSKSGISLSPSQWHEAIDDSNAIILDCRNSYESEVGLFKNSIPLNTTFFRDSWPVLSDILRDIPKDKRILTYCTGGIRCVKINAFLEQKLGFNNTARLKGGIISYTRELEQKLNAAKLGETSDDSGCDEVTLIEVNTLKKDPEVAVELLAKSQYERNVKESKFRGINYVFDDRFGARITEDILSKCDTCALPSDAYVNCKSHECNVRFIQCSKCRLVYDECCSLDCMKSHSEISLPLLPTTRAKRTNGVDDMNSVVISGNISSTSLNNSPLTSLMEYCERYSEEEPESLKQLRRDTANLFNNSEGAIRMLSGHWQGRFLKMLISLSKSSRILELGTFTGYATICLAQGLKENGTIVTCDIDERATSIAQKYFKDLGLTSRIDFRLDRCDKVIKDLKLENNLFDFVFIDADKKKCVDYLKGLMGENEDNKKILLTDGALIVVDNTLWKGLVLECGTEIFNSNTEIISEDDRKSSRMREMAYVMHNFNNFVYSHEKLEQLIFPVRDGLSIIKYSSF